MCLSMTTREPIQLSRPATLKTGVEFGMQSNMQYEQKELKTDFQGVQNQT